MRKMLGFLAGWMAASLVSVAQTAPKKIDNDLVFNKEKYSQKNINLPDKALTKLEFPLLERIEVVDVRSDSSCIGFRNRRTEKNNQTLQFSAGLKSDLETFLNKNSHYGNGPYAAVLVVKNYWVNEFGVDEDEEDKISDNRSGKYNFRKSALRATFDLYLSRDDAYYVAYRFDTLATAFLGILDFADNYLGPLLISSVSRLQEINPDVHIANKRKFSRKEFENYYEQRWDKPILKSNQYVKGVYKNFTEFVNNQPSIVQYVVKKDKLVDMLYIPVGKDQLSPARDVWGYCDGNKIFIKSGENFYPLVRVQNAFYFLGSKELLREQDDYYMPPDPYTGTSMRVVSEPYLRNRLVPMKVDMDKGTTY